MCSAVRVFAIELPTRDEWSCTWGTRMLTVCSFQYIIRLLNTNVDGKQKVMYALTKIKGVGRRYSNLVCKKADVDLTKRAGDLTSEELERLVTIIQNPLQCKRLASLGLAVIS